MASKVSAKGVVTCNSCSYFKTFGDLQEAVKDSIKHDNDHATGMVKK